MKNTDKPAYRLTPDCIWNTFLSSNKRHLVITGKRASGKSTLLNGLPLPPLPGITSWAQPSKAVYIKDNTSGQSVQTGRFDPSLPGPGNQMVLCDDGFESFAIPVLEGCIASPSPWVSIDEIGYLEARCEPYHQAILRVMEHKRLICVVRKQDIPFINHLCSREDVFLVDLDEPFGSNGCVIMASGLGKRFGGNKLMADFGGRPLICRILDATEGIFAGRVVVTRHSQVAELCSQRNIRVVLHDLPGRNDTVRLGLEAVGDVENCMFCTGDQPLLTRESVASLALAGKADGGSIWRAAFNGTEGSPVLFPKWTFPQLMSLPEGKGGGVIIKKYPEHLHTVNVRDMYELADIDSPDDLISLMERL